MSPYLFSTRADRPDGAARENGSRRAWALVLLLVAGCGRATPPTDSAGQPAVNAVRSVVERGPLRATVVAEPGTVRLSDEPTLTLTLDYEIGVKVEKPPFGDAVGNFLIRDFREPLPEVRENREIQRQIYKLEPTVTGAATIDPIVVYFVDGRPNGDGQRHSLETEALTIQVNSVLDTESPSLNDLAGLDDPLALPPVRQQWPWWVGSAAIVVAMAGAYWMVRRRRPAVPEIVLSPRERAIRELDALWFSHVASTDVKQFYVTLTSIVRRYIESTTGIHAPERTTEEFLREVSGASAIPQDSRERLQEFLESADLVKFAAHNPRQSDINESFQRARSFVDTRRGEPA